MNNSWILIRFDGKGVFWGKSYLSNVLKLIWCGFLSDGSILWNVDVTSWDLVSNVWIFLDWVDLLKDLCLWIKDLIQRWFYWDWNGFNWWLVMKSRIDALLGVFRCVCVRIWCCFVEMFGLMGCLCVGGVLSMFWWGFGC